MTETLPTQPAFRPCSGETWRDPFPMYAALRRDDPVHHVAHGDHWVLSRFADVFDAARDPATFSSAQGLSTTYGERETLGIDEIAPMVMLDPPDHTAFRRLVSAGFTPRRVAPLEPAIRAFVRERVRRLRDEPSSDVVDVLFKPLPSFVVAHFLGVPGPDRDRFDGWTLAIVAANAAGDATAAVDAVGDMFGYFSDRLARTLTRDVEIEGTTIAAGRRVLLLYGSANRDEREFGDDAAELDVERRIARLVTFGYGAHHCLGAAVASSVATSRCRSHPRVSRERVDLAP
jgi:cytochrome P450